MSVKSTKKFGGKVYQLFDFAFTKSEADKEARGQRKRGFFARVVRAGDGYQLWLRKMHRGEC